MDLVRRNASREELLEFFIAKFKTYSTCTSVFAIEVLIPADEKNLNDWRLKGIFQEGIQQKRWQNYCQYISGIKEGNHWAISLALRRQDEFLISRVWESDPKNQGIFNDIRRIVDYEKANWLSILLLPAPSALYPVRIIAVTYEAGRTEEGAPHGGEQDWRLLMFFRHIYDLSLFGLRREAKRIIDHRKELLRDLAPSIIHHEIHSRIINSQRALELLKNRLDRLPKNNQELLQGLVNSLLGDIDLLQRITHSLMGLQRRAQVEQIFLKNELQMLKDLTIFRMNKIGGILKINCSDDLKISTDSALLLQILVNLVNNAVDAMTLLKEKDYQFQPLLTISAAEGEQGDKHGVVIFISDNGKGVEPEIAARIFEVGYTTKRGGHGLGLPISNLIAGFLGGTLGLAEQGDVQGATFRLGLPLVAPAAQDIQRELEVTINE